MLTRLTKRNCTQRAQQRRAFARMRGVSGVLSMMFLILFGSLAAAMAAVSQGNLRTADTHQRILRAQGAVDSSLDLGMSRLQEAVSRFVVSKGDITPNYATALWYGTYGSSPPVVVIPPKDGRIEFSLPTGIMQALEFHHASDDPTNIANDITLAAPPPGWVRGAPIGLLGDGAGRVVTAAQIDYVPPDALGRVLIIATGYEWDWMRDRWVTRTVQQYFQITKTLKHAIISPSRIMIGRNVAVMGPIGIRYASAALDTLDGPPLVSRSDFYGLDPILDLKLDDFYAAVLADDVDGDNRLRTAHLVESRNLAAMNLTDYSGIGAPSEAFADGSFDGAIDDFDIFLAHFDTNNDGKLILASSLTDGTMHAGLGAEFTLDNSLATLIDGGKPDRNRNGRWNGVLENGVWDFTTFPDNNGDGTLDLADIDADDIILGYRDGAIDFRDQYAKIRGTLSFAAVRADWESATDRNGVLVNDYQRFIEGPIRAPQGLSPIEFEAGSDEVPYITQDSFAAAAQTMSDFVTASGAPTFQAQVEAVFGGGYTPPIKVESTPFGSPTPADWYARPVIQGVTFRNVTIPMGTNALFIDCVFVGVTRVQSYIDNTHLSWSFYGQEMRDTITGSLRYVYPPPPDLSDAQLDKSYTVPDAPNYASLPDPLIVPFDADGDGLSPDTVYNTKLLANNIRFHDCIFVGSIIADKPTLYTHVRNKLQFSGETVFAQTHPDFPNNPIFNLTAAEADISKLSSMMLPHYSVDIGTNNSPLTQDVQLQGAVIAGVLDVRGNATIRGALLLTYEPVYGAPPMSQYGTPVGNPEQFNVTLGYFGPEDGDDEGISLAAMTDLDGNGSPDVGWDSARDSLGTLVELGTVPFQESWFDGIPDGDADPTIHIRRAIPFNGFGKITIELQQNLVMPDGLAIPMTAAPLPKTYLEGRFAN